MSPRTLTERLITAHHGNPRDYSDELHTAAALLRTTHVDSVARVLDLLIAEVDAARDAELEAQAVRRRLA